MTNSKTDSAKEQRGDLTGLSYKLMKITLYLFASVGITLHFFVEIPSSGYVDIGLGLLLYTFILALCVYKQPVRQERLAVFESLLIGYLLTVSTFIFINSAIDSHLRADLESSIKTDESLTEENKKKLNINVLLYGSVSLDEWSKSTVSGYIIPVQKINSTNPKQKINDAEETVLELQDKLTSHYLFSVRRYVNGQIQFITLLVFYGGIIFLIIFNLRQARIERKIIVSPKKLGLKVGSIYFRDIKGNRGILNKTNSVANGSESVIVTDARYGNFVNNIDDWYDILSGKKIFSYCLDSAKECAMTYRDSFSRTEALNTLNRNLEHMRAEFESRQSMGRYFIWAVPSIGFVGTIIGISDALGSAYKVIADETSKQEAAIREIVTHLSTAFDTTLVSLLLSIPLMLFIHTVSRFEEKNIDLHKQRMISDHLMCVEPSIKGHSEVTDWQALMAKHVDNLSMKVVDAISAWEQERYKQFNQITMNMRKGNIDETDT